MKDDNMQRKERSDIWGSVFNAFHAFSKELLFVLFCLIAFIALLRTVAEVPFTLKVMIVVGLPLLFLSLAIWALVRGVRKNIISALEIATAAGFILSYIVLRYLARNM